MIVKEIELINYRSYSNNKFAFFDKGALITGRNGIGKTNLLEAVTYFSLGKSHKKLKDGDLIKFGENFFFIKIIFQCNGRDICVNAGYDRNNKKIIKVNDVLINKNSELLKYLKVVYFSPSDTDLIYGSPGVRRRFFDLAVSQTDFRYLEILKKYNQILKQRNALLRSEFNLSEKRVWDRRFAEKIYEISRMRKDYLADFNKLAVEKYSQVSGALEKIEISYKSAVPDEYKDSVKSVNEYIAAGEEKEIRYERSLVGVHLDDYFIRIDGIPAREFSSQGQARSIACALRLAQAELIFGIAGERPVLIFDDVMADLDKMRVNNLIKAILGKYQIFIASPDGDLYRDLNLNIINLENI
ncbi:MAG: hypothetical protein CSB55_05185 [Candidatus Cloacimonadota bacterium]|nr:MAG: hypothetical protein CSB55_05185 [Candidatus Cloacimonadota bacterium]